MHKIVESSSIKYKNLYLSNFWKKDSNFIPHYFFFIAINILKRNVLVHIKTQTSDKSMFDVEIFKDHKFCAHFLFPRRK